MWCQQNKSSHCLQSYSRKSLDTLGFNVKIIETQKCWLEGTSVSYLVQALTWCVTISSSRSTNARKNNNHFKDVKLMPLVNQKMYMLSISSWSPTRRPTRLALLLEPSAAFSSRPLIFEPLHFWFSTPILTLRCSFLQTAAGRLQVNRSAELISEATSDAVSPRVGALLRSVSWAGNRRVRWKSTEICFEC